MARAATAAIRLLAGEHEPVRLATTANITLSGLQTIDGVLTAAGDRVLVKNQTDATTNGIYQASTGAWFRAPDARTTRTMQKGMTVHVQAGSTNAGNVYTFTADNPDVGNDDVTFAFYTSDSVLEDANAAKDDAETAAAAAQAVLADADFQTVVGLAGDIATVAARDADIGTVAARDTDIGTVADADAAIATVAGIAANVTTVAGIAANVTTVAGIAANVTSVAGNATNINAVAANETNIDAVAANATNINAVAADATDIGIVAGLDTEIAAVVANATNINAVAGNEANIDTVAGIAASVSAVAAIDDDVSIVAGNIAAILAAPGFAQDAEDAATAAAASAAGVNLPPIQAGDAGKQLFVTVGEDGYELLPAAGGAVDSVNGLTGVVVLDAGDVGAQPASANLDEYAAVNPTAAGLALLDDADAAAQRTTLGLGTAATQASSAFATAAQGTLADGALQKATEDQTITGGAGVTSKSLGTQSSGTLTLDMGDRPLQHYTNGGAHTLAPGTVNGSCLVDITNNGSAGAITTSGWTKVSGDSFTTTNGHKFRCHASVGNGGSYLVVGALQ